MLREIAERARLEGFRSLAEAVRTVMTVWARSPKVQEAVRRDLALALNKNEAGR